MGKTFRRILVLLILIAIVFAAGKTMVKVVGKLTGKIGNDIIRDLIGKDKSNETDRDTDDLEEEDTTKEKTYRYTRDNLNLRTGPSSNHEILFTIPKGEVVELIGEEDGWSNIIYNSSKGYSFSEYLSEEEPMDIVVDGGGADLDIIEPKETMKVIKGILLVNKEYGLPMDYDPGEDVIAKEYLNKMIDACYEEIGKKLNPFSGYRTYEYQKNLFNRYVDKEGYEKAMMYSARPGHSEHETGLTYDIGGQDQKMWLKEAFENTEEGIWLRDNAHRFGYILRYPKGKTDITGYIYEPWHFRYIGVDHAGIIYENDITLEEYLFGDY